jgi:hypothetical protein
MLRNSFIQLFLLFFLTSQAIADDAVCNLSKLYRLNNQSAEYQEGVDVYGKPVVPADINGLKPLETQSFKMPISIDLAEYFSKDLSDAIITETEVHFVEIFMDGRVLYNNQDFTEQTIALCSEKQLQTNTSKSKPMKDDNVLYISKDKAIDKDDGVIWGEAH